MNLILMIISDLRFDPEGARGDPDLEGPEDTRYKLCSQNWWIVRTLHGLLTCNPV